MELRREFQRAWKVEIVLPADAFSYCDFITYQGVVI